MPKKPKEPKKRFDYDQSDMLTRKRLVEDGLREPPFNFFHETIKEIERGKAERLKRKEQTWMEISRRMPFEVVEKLMQKLMREEEKKKKKKK